MPVNFRAEIGPCDNDASPPMPDANQINNDSVNRIEKLKTLDSCTIELWKYYEDRANRLGERMWSVGIWLITIINATLSLSFVGGLMNTQVTFPYLNLKNPVGIALLAVFGASFCVYSYFALRDLREHIESNWRKAGYLIDGTWQVEWSGRKSHGWNVLVFVGALALVAFAGLLLLAWLSV